MTEAKKKPQIEKKRVKGEVKKKVVKKNVVQVKLNPLNKFSYNQMPNHGFKFALLDPSGKALHTPVMCKDYLQDIFWCEHTGNSGKLYGLEWEGGKFDVKAKRFRLAVIGGGVKMSPKIKSLQEFLNYFDKAQGIKPSVVLETQNDEVIVVDFDNDWTKCGPMLSAFTTMIRVSGAYKGGDPMEYLKSLNKPLNDPKTYKSLWEPEPAYIKVEVARLSTNLPRLAALLAGKVVKHSWDKINSMAMAHVCGIMGFQQFPTVEVDQ